MGQEADEPFGTIGGLAGEAGRDGARDRAELALDRGVDAVASRANERIEGFDRPIEPADRHLMRVGRRLAPPSEVLEGDHITHDRTVHLGADTPGDAAPRTPERGLIHACEPALAGR